jgi:hypothetical protein
MKYEKEDPETGERYTWVQGESLAELAKPERVAEIKREYDARVGRQAKHATGRSLADVFTGEEGDESPGCTICHL